MREDHEILAVRYFSAPIKTYPYDAAALDRQKIYLQALSTCERVSVQLGYYSKNATLFPACDEPCKTCDRNPQERGVLRVVKLEKKQSDVNIACAMLTDAYNDVADSFVLVSGDTDFTTPICILRKELKKNVIVLNPHTRRSDLERYASYYQDIPLDLPARCQLPDSIPIGTHGNFIHRLAAWR